MLTLHLLLPLTTQPELPNHSTVTTQSHNQSLPPNSETIVMKLPVKCPSLSYQILLMTTPKAPKIELNNRSVTITPRQRKKIKTTKS